MSFLALAVVFSATAATPPDTLTVEQAIAIAQERTRDVIQARTDVLLADVEKMRALAAILPRFDVTISGGETFTGKAYLEERVGGSGPFVDFQSGNASQPAFSLGITGRQLIFDGGRWWTVLSRADRLHEQSTQLLRAVENDVRAAAVRAYYELGKAERSRDTFLRQIKNDEEQLQRVRDMLSTGIAKQGDVATAERNLTQDQIELAARTYAVRDAARRLNIALGRAADTPVKLASNITEEADAPAKIPGTQEELSANAAKVRPELLSARTALEVARQEITISRAAHYPVVSAGVSYSKLSRKPDRVFGDPTENYFASFDLSLAWNIFSGGAVSADVEAAELSLVKLEASYSDLERSVMFEVQRAFDSVALFGEQHALAKKNIKVATTALDLAKAGYQAGRGTLLELRDAEQGLTLARLIAIEARLNLEISREELRRAVGADLSTSPR